MTPLANHVLYEPVNRVDAEVRNEDKATYRASRLTLCFSLDQLMEAIRDEESTTQDKSAEGVKVPSE